MVGIRVDGWVVGIRGEGWWESGWVDGRDQGMTDGRDHGGRMGGN